MTLPDLALNVGSSVTRNVPYFRGLGTLYRLFNDAMMKLGAQPLVTARMKDGTTAVVDLRTHTELDAYYLGEYDSPLTAAVRALVDPDACFVDVGANVGFYTLSLGAWLRARRGRGRVVAFEPVPGNYDRLVENLRANGLEGRCEAHKVGLSNRRTQTLITLREDFVRGSSTGNAAIPTAQKFDEGFARVAIALERLDELWPRLYGDDLKIDLVKMDIEGHEDFCLDGARRTIAAHRPTILMEVNKPYYAARGIVLDAVFLPLLPEAYAIYRHTAAGWRRTATFEECRDVDNVFLVPEERLALERYGLFAAGGAAPRSKP